MNPKSSIPIPQSGPTVFLVDDDPSVRKGLSRLLQSAGFRVEAFASAEAFLKRESPERGGCLVLDMRMPGVNGFELQEALAGVVGSLPIIFITGHGDIPMSVRAMKKGAVDFLSKPFDEQALLAAIAVALARDKAAREQRVKTQGIRSRAKTLTPREREVMRGVVAGLLNKQIADELGISEKTVKVHRGRVMMKMAVKSVAELVRMSENAEGGMRSAGSGR